MNTALLIITGLPFAAALLLAAIPDYRISAFGNVGVMLATLAAGLSLPFQPMQAGDYFIIDEVNILFVIINTLVGFTTSIFSAS